MWWAPDGPDGTVYNEEMVADHTINLSLLKPNTFYEYRIRSNNDPDDSNVPEQVIWGYVGSFTTEP